MHILKRALTFKAQPKPKLTLEESWNKVVTESNPNDMIMIPMSQYYYRISGYWMNSLDRK